MNDPGPGWVEAVQLDPPTLKDNTADLERLTDRLAQRLKTGSIRVPRRLIGRLPAALRQWGYAARCVVFKDRSGWILVDVADPGGARLLAGAAVDLGTTRVAVSLVDLEGGAKLGGISFDNPQLAIGPDILARVHHAERPGGLLALQEMITGALNKAIRHLCSDLGMMPEHVSLVSVAGNTAMTHLFMGVEPKWMIREPYIPAVNRPGVVNAASLGFDFNPEAQVFIFPNVGSYFGGDVVAGILLSGLAAADETALLVDVGTNAEVVCGNRSWMIACAGAAGPALEGGMSQIGMAAGPGAIDRVRIDRATGRFELRTIDDRPPVGICGSGVIDLAAQLFKAGMVDIRGRLVPKACGERWVEKDGVPHIVIVPAGEGADGRDLMIGQPDLDSLIRSKAAMYTILETLVQSVGLTFDDISSFYVAGTFGAVIDPASAIAIGMLPDLPLTTFRVIGNSSLEGAGEILRSRAALDRVDPIRDSITYLELNVNQDFMNRFSAAKFLPHTDLSRFPSAPVPSARSGSRPSGPNP